MRATEPKQTVQRVIDDRRGFVSQADITETKNAVQRLDGTGDNPNEIPGNLHVEKDILWGGAGGMRWPIDGETQEFAIKGVGNGIEQDYFFFYYEPGAAGFYAKNIDTDLTYFGVSSGTPGVTPEVQLAGAFLRVYDVAGGTLLFEIDPATGRITTNITSDGTITADAFHQHNGGNLAIYSDAGTTLKFAVSGADGYIAQDGQATPGTPPAGFARLYPNTSNLYEAIDPNGDVWSVGKTQTVKKGSDQTISTTTLTTVTGMSFTLQANRAYFFEYFLIHESAASTTGLKLAINVATATISELTYQTEIQVTNTANGTTNVEVQNHTTNNSTHTAANQAANGVRSVAKVTGAIVVGGTGGTLNLQFAGDAAASITAKAGSYGRLSF